MIFLILGLIAITSVISASLVSDVIIQNEQDENKYCHDFSYEGLCGDYETVKNYALNKLECIEAGDMRRGNCVILYPNGDREILPGPVYKVYPNGTEVHTWIERNTEK